MGPPFDEVIGPDVVGPGGAQAYARAVGEPEAAALQLLLWDLQPLSPPDPLPPLGAVKTDKAAMTLVGKQ